MWPQDIESFASELREDIKSLKTKLWEYRKKMMNRDDQPLMTKEWADIGEILANLTIAYRALEDARMRMWLTLQANDGGVSCYDK